MKKLLAILMILGFAGFAYSGTFEIVTTGDAKISSAAATGYFDTSEYVAVFDDGNAPPREEAIFLFNIHDSLSARTASACTLIIKQSTMDATLKMVCFGILRNVVINNAPGQVNWNVYATGSSWTTAGAAGSGTDITSSPVSDTFVVGDTVAARWHRIPITGIDSTWYGILIKPIPLSHQWTGSNFYSDSTSYPCSLWAEYAEAGAAVDTVESFSVDSLHSDYSEITDADSIYFIWTTGASEIGDSLFIWHNTTGIASLDSSEGQYYADERKVYAASTTDTIKTFLTMSEPGWLYAVIYVWDADSGWSMPVYDSVYFDVPFSIDLVQKIDTNNVDIKLRTYFSQQTSTVDSLITYYSSTRDSIVDLEAACALDTGLALTDPCTTSIADLTENTKYYFRQVGIDEGEYDTTAIDSITTLKTVAHSLTVYDSTSTTITVINDYTANTVTSIKLITDDDADFSSIISSTTETSGIHDPDTLTVTGLPFSTVIHFKWIIIDQLGADTSDADSTTTLASGGCAEAWEIEALFIEYITPFQAELDSLRTVNDSLKSRIDSLLNAPTARWKVDLFTSNMSTYSSNTRFGDATNPANFLDTSDALNHCNVESIDDEILKVATFASGDLDSIAALIRTKILKTFIGIGYEGHPDTVGNLFNLMLAYIDGNGAGGIDADIEAIADGTRELKVGSFADGAITKAAWASTLFDTLSGIITANAGSDTTAILAMMMDNLFARVTVDTPIVLTSAGYVPATATIPDSLLDIIGRIKTLQKVVGYPGASPEWDSLQNNLFNQLGEYAGTAGNNLKLFLDSVYVYTGKSGVLTPQTSIHMILGAYSGAAGVGNNIRDDIAAVSVSGDGENVVSVYVKDDDGDFINGLDVRLENSGGGSNYWAQTNTSGLATFNLDDGTYRCYVGETPDYSQDVNPDTFTFTANYTDTVLMTDNHSPLTGLYGYVYNPANQPIKGALVTVEIPQDYWPISYDGTSIRARFSVKTDATGKFDFTEGDLDGIYPSSVLLTGQGDSSSVYTITATSGGDLIFAYTISLPDSSTINLSDIEKQ